MKYNISVLDSKYEVIHSLKWNSIPRVWEYITVIDRTRKWNDDYSHSGSYNEVEILSTQKVKEVYRNYLYYWLWTLEEWDLIETIEIII